MVGTLHIPQGTPRGWSLFAHNSVRRGDWDGAAVVRFAQALAGSGMGVLSFSLPEYSGANPSMDDMLSAAKAMNEAGMPPRLLVGHGLASVVVLAAASRIESTCAVATIAAPFDPAARIGALSRPLLLLHSPADRVVGIDNVAQIYLAAHHPKSFISLDGSDHLLSRTGDAEHAARLISAWAARYLAEEPAARAMEFDAEAEETGLGKYQLELRSGGTRWIADEPVAVGGLGTGPTPYDLLASALAACTTMTLRLYADRKGWKVTRIRTGVSHARDKSLQPPDLLTRHIFLEGELDEAQRAELMQVAERCPVHRTLQQGVRMEG